MRLSRAGRRRSRCIALRTRNAGANALPSGNIPAAPDAPHVPPALRKRRGPIPEAENTPEPVGTPTGLVRLGDDLLETPKDEREELAEQLPNKFGLDIFYHEPPAKGQ